MSQLGDDLYYLVAFLKNIKFYNTRKNVSLEPFYSDKFSYQATASIENTSLFMDIGCTIPYNFSPVGKESGIFFFRRD